MSLTATKKTLCLGPMPPNLASIDVCFDGRRVWSIDLQSTQHRAASDWAWPPALVPSLTGQTRVTILDSSTKAILQDAEVLFDDSADRTSVVNEAGGALVVNKWGLLGVTLEAKGAAGQEAILADALDLIEQLRKLGLRPFVVGGTLLGGVRSGDLLPHDDDADIAYLSRFTNPADVALEGLRIGRQLQGLGYEVVQHSAAHVQIQFRDESGTAAHYVDVFAAFFSEDGQINQPFHVRGPMTMEQMRPFSRVQIAGREFPAPADPEHWLTVNYDDNWRTPIPGYQIVTPEPTARRFDSWFGAFNFRREFWEGYFASGSSNEAWAEGRHWLLAQSTSLTAPSIIDLGTGAGQLARELARARQERRVWGYDFSDAALHAAEQAGLGQDDSNIRDRLRFERVNLYRMTALLAPSKHGIEGRFDLVMNHVVEQIGHRGRVYAWRMARMALASGGSVRLTFNSQPAVGVTPEDPTTWHLADEAVERELSKYGLRAQFKTIPEWDDGRSSRKPMGAIVQLASDNPQSSLGRIL